MDGVDYYSTLLPMYLRGENIERHSDVIEYLTKQVYSAINTLETWPILDRPILIERIQSQPSLVEYKVHITTNNPIKEIRITGGYEYNQSYQWENMKTNITIPFTLYDTTKSIPNVNFRVEVDTYNDITYIKEYPENDTEEGGYDDHDSHLDIIGSILNIPRRTYVAYPVSAGDTAIPPYFGKSTYTVDGIEYVASCTEDDYVYSQRLQQFLEDKQYDIVSAFIKARYNKNILKLSGQEVRLEDISQTFPDFVVEQNITQEWLDSNRYGIYTIYVDNTDVPVNWKFTFSNEEIYNEINKFMPCTRLSLVTDMREINVTERTIIVSLIEYTNRIRIHVRIELDFGWANFPFKFAVNDYIWNEYYNDAVTNNQGKYIYDYYVYRPSNDVTDTIVLRIKSEGLHGEIPLDISIPLEYTAYKIMVENYVGVDEYAYTLSTQVLPNDGKLTEGYTILERENVQR